jgi:hypothetical protein
MLREVTKINSQQHICRHHRTRRIPILVFPWLLFVFMCTTWQAEAALVELRMGPTAAMAVQLETDWPTVNLFAGGGLAIPGYSGSPLRNPSLNTGFRVYTGHGSSLRTYLTGMYGWTVRSAGLEPFAGGGAGVAWRFGPGRSYRLSLETDMILRNTWLPYPSAGFGLAVQL